MEMSALEIWESCLKKLKDFIPEISYATWFERLELEPVGLIKDTLFIRIPDNKKDDFDYRTVKRRYLLLIEYIVSEIRQQRTTVKIFDDSEIMIFLFTHSGELSKPEIHNEK